MIMAQLGGYQRLNQLVQGEFHNQEQDDSEDKYRYNVSCADIDDRGECQEEGPLRPQVEKADNDWPSQGPEESRATEHPEVRIAETSQAAVEMT